MLSLMAAWAEFLCKLEQKESQNTHGGIKTYSMTSLDIWFKLAHRSWDADGWFCLKTEFHNQFLLELIYPVVIATNKTLKQRYLSVSYLMFQSC